MALGRLKPHRVIAGDRGGYGAHVDEDRASGKRVGDPLPEHDVGDDLAIVEHGDDGIGAGGCLRRSIGNIRAKAAKRLGLGQGAVPHRHGEAGVE